MVVEHLGTTLRFGWKILTKSVTALVLKTQPKMRVAPGSKPVGCVLPTDRKISICLSRSPGRRASGSVATDPDSDYLELVLYHFLGLGSAYGIFGDHFPLFEPRPLASPGWGAVAGGAVTKS